MTIEERFTKIVKDLAMKLESAEREAAILRNKLTVANFPKIQATECGKCGTYKHTPWKDEKHGYGHICAACMYVIYSEGAEEPAARIKERPAEQDLAELTSILTEMTARGYWLYFEANQLYEARFFPIGKNVPKDFDAYKSTQLLAALRGAAAMEHERCMEVKDED